MSKEQPGFSILEFAKDATGISAYECFRRGGDNRLVATLGGFLEVLTPASCKISRERVGVPTETLYLEGNLPDVVNLMVSTAIGCGIELATDNRGFAVGGLITARLVFNGLVQRRLNRLLND